MSIKTLLEFRNGDNEKWMRPNRHTTALFQNHILHGCILIIMAPRMFLIWNTT